MPIIGGAAAAAGVAFLLLAGSVAGAPPPPGRPSAHGSGLNVEPFVIEAAARFDLPRRWIEAVARQESGFRPFAVSPKGARGLMQIMPATWTGLRQDFGLGADPFDPRDNLLAGAGYLRRLRDQFGDPGFLAAYNAGSARYLDYLLNGRPLPAETRRYVAVVGAEISGSGTLAGPATPAPTPFAPIAGGRRSTRAAADPLQPTRLSDAGAAPANALFAGAWRTPR